jgi:hypothetical protein
MLKYLISVSSHSRSTQSKHDLGLYAREGAAKFEHGRGPGCGGLEYGRQSCVAERWFGSRARGRGTKGRREQVLRKGEGRGGSRVWLRG